MKEINLSVKARKKYSICSCGLSKSLPYCDNEHRQYNSENSTQYNINDNTIDYYICLNLITLL